MTVVMACARMCVCLCWFGYQSGDILGKLRLSLTEGKDVVWRCILLNGGSAFYLWRIRIVVTCWLCCHTISPFLETWLLRGWSSLETVLCMLQIQTDLLNIYWVPWRCYLLNLSEAHAALIVYLLCLQNNFVWLTKDWTTWINWGNEGKSLFSLFYLLSGF